MQIPGWAFLCLFLAELGLLFFCSRKMTQALGALVYQKTGSFERFVEWISLVFLPGTLIHELSHVLVAGVLFVDIGEVELVPKVVEGRLKLGSAQIGRTDPLRRGLIGVAPVLLGLALLFGMVWFILNNHNSWWVFVLSLLVIFEVSNTMFSSPKDLEGSAEMIALIVGVLGAGLIAHIYTLEYLNRHIFSKQFTQFIQLGSLYLLIPILIDIGIYFLVKGLKKVSVRS